MPTFPTLASTARTQFPWTHSLRFMTVSAVQTTGERTAYSLRTTGLRSWSIGGPALTDTDLATLRNFFISQGGKLNYFDFVDPRDGTTYTNCRFDMDSFEYQTIEPNVHRAEIRIVQVP